MDEQKIAENLKQNVPTTQPQDPEAPKADSPSDGVITPVLYDLDDVTSYKLNMWFEQAYRPSDAVMQDKLKYIYSHVASIVDTTDYSVIVSKIKDIERMLGTGNSQNRVHRLYQWLKLDNARRKVEMEMASLGGSER